MLGLGVTLAFVQQRIPIVVSLPRAVLLPLLFGPHVFAVLQVVFCVVGLHVFVVLLLVFFV